MSTCTAGEVLAEVNVNVVLPAVLGSYHIALLLSETYNL